MPLPPAVAAAFAAYRADNAEAHQAVMAAFASDKEDGWKAAKAYVAAASLALGMEEEEEEEEEEDLDFDSMTELHLRQWVEANPGRVNCEDPLARTPLFVAAKKHTLSLVLWLLDKGAFMSDDVLCVAGSADIIKALLDLGHEPDRRVVFHEPDRRLTYRTCLMGGTVLS